MVRCVRKASTFLVTEHEHLLLLYDGTTSRFIAAPAAIGPYSQAIKVGDLLFCSGCIPLNPATMEVVEGGVQAQTKQALKNLKSVVEAGGSELGKVAKTTVRVLFTSASISAS